MLQHSMQQLQDKAMKRQEEIQIAAFLILNQLWLLLKVNVNPKTLKNFIADLEIRYLVVLKMPRQQENDNYARKYFSAMFISIYD